MGGARCLQHDRSRRRPAYVRQQGVECPDLLDGEPSRVGEELWIVTGDDDPLTARVDQDRTKRRAATTHPADVRAVEALGHEFCQRAISLRIVPDARAEAGRNPETGADRPSLLVDLPKDDVLTAIKQGIGLLVRIVARREGVEVNVAIADVTLRQRVGIGLFGRERSVGGGQILSRNGSVPRRSPAIRPPAAARGPGRRDAPWRGRRRRGWGRPNSPTPRRTGYVRSDRC